MTDWFTTEAIDNDTVVISEYKHWEETHCYLLIGTESALLIDTGLGVSDIKDVVGRYTSLPVIVATTHVHWDHIGGHSLFDDIAVHAAEVPWLSRFPLPREAVINSLTCRPCAFPDGFDIARYRVFQGAPSRILRDGQRIDLGNRTVTAVHTPGHSPGHCCFYEADRRYLFSGDLVYRGCLDAFYPSTNPVEFMHSVEKVNRLAVDRVLPAHHSPDIPVSLTDEIAAAFRSLYNRNALVQGNGIFDFGSFQIRI